MCNIFILLHFTSAQCNIFNSIATAMIPKCFYLSTTLDHSILFFSIPLLSFPVLLCLCLCLPFQIQIQPQQLNLTKALLPLEEKGSGLPNASSTPISIHSFLSSGKQWSWYLLGWCPVWLVAWSSSSHHASTDTRKGEGLNSQVQKRGKELRRTFPFQQQQGFT